MNVLVVNDSISVRKALARFLASHTLTSITVGSTAEAISVLSRGDTSLILVDVVMPGMNGFEFCQYVRSEPRFEAVPVVLIASAVDAEARAAATAAGAFAIVQKPFTPDTLFLTIEAALTSVAKFSAAQALGADQAAQIEQARETDEAVMEAVRYAEALLDEEMSASRQVDSSESKQGADTYTPVALPDAVLEAITLNANAVAPEPTNLDTLPLEVGELVESTSARADREAAVRTPNLDFAIPEAGTALDEPLLLFDEEDENPYPITAGMGTLDMTVGAPPITELEDFLSYATISAALLIDTAGHCINEVGVAPLAAASLGSYLKTIHSVAGVLGSRANNADLKQLHLEFDGFSLLVVRLDRVSTLVLVFQNSSHLAWVQQLVQTYLTVESVLSSA